MPEGNEIPFMFMRQTRGNPHKAFIVKMALWDYREYNAGWMGDPKLDPNHYETHVPDVDLTSAEWLFDSGTSLENEMAAIAKMKELWTCVQIVPTFDSIDLSIIIHNDGAITVLEDNEKNNG